jgi:ComF family protein
MKTNPFNDLRESLLHLVFPHVCEGCGTDILQQDHFLCLRCLSDLPQTSFHIHSHNPVEKAFWGRLPVTSATAQYYFTRQSVIQHLMHQIKYKGNKELGYYLGKLMGTALGATNRFAYADALVPLPLFPAKEKKRGYNQAKILCEGMASVMIKPVIDNVVYRAVHTETQTKKNRVERWQNIEKGFALSNSHLIEGKHLILVDDVITTGATLEACGRALLQCNDVQLSVASLCFSSGY